MKEETNYENGYFEALDDILYIIEKSANCREAIDKIKGFIQGVKTIKRIQIVIKDEEERNNDL